MQRSAVADSSNDGYLIVSERLLQNVLHTSGNVALDWNSQTNEVLPSPVIVNVAALITRSACPSFTQVQR